MSDPTARNRLGDEASPYLREHADNPVNWQPWDETALAAARERDVPIFLSIGYSACHWCHVMEEESFEDEAVADLLNESFVPIKVDREERPDLDRIYQTVCHKVSGGGGWPLSVWLTPEGNPFYVGTYFPKRAQRNQPGFLDVCENVANSWADPEQREEMRQRGEQWAATARDELETTGGAATTGSDSAADATAVGADPSDGAGGGDEEEDDAISGTLDDAVTTAIRSADREHGGFGRGGPKFPQPGRIDLLLRAAERSDDETPLRVATETLDAMANGGLYDQIGGGFHRYCTDREWVVPHFEKMLYDNGSLARVYLDAYRLTGRPRYAVVASETLAFLDRELGHPEGGFYATLDADSGGEEGAFYVWDEASLRAALDAELAEETLAELGVDRETAGDVLRDRFGVDEPNFERGQTVATVAATASELAESHDLERATVRQLLRHGRAALYDAREERERPPRDDKVIGAWNGLAVSAFAAGARTLDAGLADRGAAALSFVREHLWDGERLARRYVDPDDLPDAAGGVESHGGDGGDEGDGGDGGDDPSTPVGGASGAVGGAKGTGYLDDYAFLARGALELYGVTGEVEHLSFALELADVIHEAFYDAEAGTIYATPADGESLIARPQEPTDRSTPSSLGVAVSTLLALDGFRPDAGYAEAARAALATHRDRIAGRPLEHVTLALGAAADARGSLEVTLAADEWPAEWRETLANQYLADAVLAPRPATESGLSAWLDTLGLSEAPPVWANREARDGAPTAYVCRGRACSPPRTELFDALTWTPGE
ncbi:thioredoxin domain-containing protein [Halobaculum sp. MBLA0147]|uniref:thioredoxin domain-containing protein n=1 Tax=Halobaculum sp. MBLA0147 TaxID=3079934 RepID=UPI0035264AEC